MIEAFDPSDDACDAIFAKLLEPTALKNFRGYFDKSIEKLDAKTISKFLRSAVFSQKLATSES